jgi:branched-chain amino acid transport system permease protein
MFKAIWFIWFQEKGIIMKDKHLKIAGVLAIIFLFVLPIFVNSYTLHIIILIFSFGYLSSAWNIIGGFGGQLSLGHALFFGVGAYTSTLMFTKMGISPWIGMFFGGCISAVIALPIGIIVFRYKLHGVFFSIATLCFAEIFRILVSQMRFTGGAEGLLIPIMKSSLWSFQFKSKLPYYYISYLMILFMLFICYEIKKSKIYYYLFAVKSDENAASAIGVNANKFKTIAFVISAFFTSFNGTFFAQYYMFIEPETTFSIPISIDILMRPIIGGMGTLFGPILGSFIMTPLSEVIREIVGSGMSGFHLLVYGVFLILICMWMPGGIISYFTRFVKTG